MAQYLDLTKAFQSTLPARGATHRRGLVGTDPGRFQSTLPARGATHKLDCLPANVGFQSTLPARGATFLDGFGDTT